MYKFIVYFVFIVLSANLNAQSFKTVKQKLETSPNPIETVKKTLKKKYRLDTIVVYNTKFFQGQQDSLAFNGKIGKVYGPYDSNRLAVQILGRASNKYNRIAKISFDTSNYSFKFADSLSKNVLQRLQANTLNFFDASAIYNINWTAKENGDMGYSIQGSLQPELEKKMKNTKPGQYFSYWNETGVHVVKVLEKNKEIKNSVALMLVVFL
jgi:hypothetical protein